MNTLQTLLAFLAALTLLIFVHELGHYLVARWFDVKILRFSIGFGRPLLSWRVGPDRTEWTIAAIPLGGFVRMLDEREQDATIPAHELPRAFSRKSLRARSAIVVAGPLANFLLAILLYALLGWVGVEEPSPIVDAPTAASAAERAGLRAGDRIVAIDDAVIRSWNEVRLKLLEPVIERRDVRLSVERDARRIDLVLATGALPEGEAERAFLQSLGLGLAPGRVFIDDVVAESAAAAAGLQTGDEILAIDGRAVRRAGDVIAAVRVVPPARRVFDVRRAGDELRIPVLPRAESDAAGKPVARIGARLQDRVKFETVRHGPLESLAIGARQTWDMSWFSLRMMGKMLTGDLSLRNLSGPVTIADLAGRTVRVGWYAYVSFLALISISLGVLNLLPIPVLDGGHLVYYGLEALRGRPLSERFLELSQKAGLGVIMLMMALALFNDITRLIGS